MKGGCVNQLVGFDLISHSFLCIHVSAVNAIDELHPREIRYAFHVRIRIRYDKISIYNNHLDILLLLLYYYVYVVYHIPRMVCVFFFQRVCLSLRGNNYRYIDTPGEPAEIHTHSFTLSYSWAETPKNVSEVNIYIVLQLLTRICG